MGHMSHQTMAAGAYLKGELLVLRLCDMGDDGGLVQVVEDAAPVPHHKHILPILPSGCCPLEEGHHACGHRIC